MTKGNGSAGGQQARGLISDGRLSVPVMAGNDQRWCRATAGNGGSPRDPDGNE
jgi:hypothetical protein